MTNHSEIEINQLESLCSMNCNHLHIRIPQLQYSYPTGKLFDTTSEFLDHCALHSPTSHRD